MSGMCRYDERATEALSSLPPELYQHPNLQHHLARRPLDLDGLLPARAPNGALAKPDAGRFLLHFANELVNAPTSSSARLSCTVMGIWPMCHPQYK